jgi:hypothetical protein
MRLIQIFHTPNHYLNDSQFQQHFFILETKINALLKS